MNKAHFNNKGEYLRISCLLRTANVPIIIPFALVLEVIAVPRPNSLGKKYGIATGKEEQNVCRHHDNVPYVFSEHGRDSFLVTQQSSSSGSSSGGGQ